MLNRIERAVFGLIDLVLVLLLAAMFAMVFGNVVLRYGFNSGIIVSEEMSRIFFVWLTFLGAVTVFRDRQHVGVDALVMILPRAGRLVCRVLGDLIILGCCAAFFWGTWLQAPINATMMSPVTGVPLSWINGVGFIASSGIFAICAVRLVNVLRGRLSHEERVALYAGLPGEPTQFERPEDRA